MCAARILALGGTLASALTMIGGLAGSTAVVGAVLAGVGRERRCCAVSPEGRTCTVERAHRTHVHHNIGWWA